MTLNLITQCYIFIDCFGAASDHDIKPDHSMLYIHWLFRCFSWYSPISIQMCVLLPILSQHMEVKGRQIKSPNIHKESVTCFLGFHFVLRTLIQTLETCVMTWTLCSKREETAKMSRSDYGSLWCMMSRGDGRDKGLYRKRKWPDMATLWENGVRI